MNQEAQQDWELPNEIQSILREYRDALPDSDTAAGDFKPQLWAKIESQQKVTYSLWRLASGFVTGSVALSMVLAFALWTPPQSSQQKQLGPNSTYVEVLDDASDDAPELANI